MLNQTATTFSFNQIKFMGSVLACSLFFFSSSAYKPCLLLALYFVYQAIIQYFTYHEQKTESRFMEDFWTGPIKLAVALYMVTSAIPSENTAWGLVWIGVAVLFMLSGIRSLYLVMKSSGEETASTPSGLDTVSFKQLKKLEKQQEVLMADIAAFLDRPDRP